MNDKPATLDKDRLDTLERLARACEAAYGPVADVLSLNERNARCHAQSNARFALEQALGIGSGYATILALVAAYRERDELVKALSDGAASHAKTQAMVAGLSAGIDCLTKERDELRARVAELEYAVRHPDDLAYAKGREDERRDVLRVALTMRTSTALRMIVMAGEHVRGK